MVSRNDGPGPALPPEAERQRLARLIGRLLARHWLRKARDRPPAAARAVWPFAHIHDPVRDRVHFTDFLAPTASPGTCDFTPAWTRRASAGKEVVSARTRPISRDDFARAFAGAEAERYPPVLSPAWLADLLGLPPKTIAEWIAKGRLDGAFRKRGKQVLIWHDRAGHPV
jgi:hypothetical protein